MNRIKVAQLKNPVRSLANQQSRESQDRRGKAYMSMTRRHLKAEKRQGRLLRAIADLERWAARTNSSIHQNPQQGRLLPVKRLLNIAHRSTLVVLSSTRRERPKT